MKRSDIPTEAKAIKKTSAEWTQLFDCVILDFDGWDRKNFDHSFYEEKITQEEFQKRLLLSTQRILNRKIGPSSS